MPLAAMGEILRGGRQKRGLSVEEIAAQLKISPRLIRDLEAGNEPSLPHAVYVRGFIKSYARLLDINPDDLAAGLAVYEREEEVTPPPPRPRSGRLGLMLLALLCALAFGGYWYYNTYLLPARQTQPGDLPTTRSEPAGKEAESTPPPASQEPQAAPAPQPAPASQAPVPAAVPIPSSPPAPGAQGAPSAPTLPDSQAAGEPAADEETQVQAQARTEPPAGEAPARGNAFPAPERESPAVGGERAVAANPDAPAGAAPAASISQLVLTGMAECWVYATADTTDTREFSIYRNEIFSLSFSKTLVLKLGNAGGVRLQYNGTDLPVPGRPGQVVTLRFPRAGSG